MYVCYIRITYFARKKHKSRCQQNVNKQYTHFKFSQLTSKNNLTSDSLFINYAKWSTLPANANSQLMQKENKAIAICYSQLPILNIRKGKRIARVLFITFAYHKDRTILCAHQHLKFQVFTRNWLNGFQPKTRNFRLKSYEQRTAKRQSKLNHKTLPATWILASSPHQLCTHSILPAAIYNETNSHSNARSSRRKVSSYPSGQDILVAYSQFDVAHLSFVNSSLTDSYTFKQ